MGIHEKIVAAGLEDIFDTQTGDCVSVAVAIRDVFGGRYVCAYQSSVDTTPAHATVEIDDILYDGDGRTYEESLYDMAISGLTNIEIENYEDHISKPTKLRNNQLYDENTKKSVEKRLEMQ